jgi:hypothetical protein
MSLSGSSKRVDKTVRSPVVRLRLYVSGRSEYTRSVLDTIDRILERYEPSEFMFEVRDATEAEESEHVFFTPMLIVRDDHEPGRRTVLVGDLRKAEVVKGVLTRFGIHERSQPRS